MTNRNLFHWFSSSGSSPPQQEETYSINKNVFYLNWDIGSKYPKQIAWLHQPPDGCNIIKKIRLRNIGEVIVCGHYHCQAQVDPFQELSNFEKRINYKEFTNVSLLKSHLQKCVRRKLDTLSVLTSFHLMRLNILEFCRRFPIIMIEDTCLHECFSVICWLMAIGPELVIDDTVVHYLLGCVQLAAVSPHTDCARDEKYYRHKVSEITNQEISQLWNDCAALSTPKATILLSLLLRRSFGGMKSDGAMLLASCQYWLHHHSDLTTRFYDKIRPVNITRYLSIQEMELSAVDFHCYPGMVTKIQKLYPELTESDIREMIWDFRSSYNLRLPSPHILSPRHPVSKWSLIQEAVDRISRNYIYYRQ